MRSTATRQSIAFRSLWSSQMASRIDRRCAASTHVIQADNIMPEAAAADRESKVSAMTAQLGDG